MRIVVDIGPIDSNSTSGHKVRGVGKYIKILRDNLQKFDETNTYIFSSNPSKERGIDLIHYPYFDPFFITLPLIKRTKSLVTVHDVIPLSHAKQFPVGIKGNIKWKLNKALLKQVNGIITDSFASKDQIHKITGISEKKIYPVHLAVDHEFKRLEKGAWENKIRKKYSLPEVFVLYVGDVTWNKNLPNIVVSAKKTNIPLVIVGKALSELNFDVKNPWNSDRKIVLDQTLNNPLFIKLGFVPTDELVEIYNLAQALLMPSFDEGFGLPVLEAMKSGCPVITSDRGSLAEVAGDAAIYVDPDDPESISKAIGLILVSKSLKNELVDKGFEQAKHFSIEKMMKDTITVYNTFSHEK